MKKLLKMFFMKEFKYILRNGLPLTIYAVTERQALRYAVKREYEAFLTQEKEKVRKLQIMHNLHNLKVPDDLVDDILRGMSA